MRFLLLLSFSCLVFFCSAQKLSESSIVKDSSGTIIPAAIWKQLMMKGFVLKPEHPGDAESPFILAKLSEKQVQERYERGPKPRETEYFTTGQKISLFNTTDMNGNKLNLKKLQGKIVVLNFWFINCPPCRMEIPDLNELVDSFKTNDKVIFVAVALDSKWDLKDFLKTSPFSYSIVDDGRFIAQGYGIRSYPTHVIVDTEGRVYFHTTGLTMNTVYWLKKSINELLAKQSTSIASQ